MPVLYVLPVMTKAPLIQEDLINRYDRQGPRYTSYPPASEFHDRIDEGNYRDWARASNEELIPKPLSLYFHIPFCSSLCHYCACNEDIAGRREKAEPYLRDLRREIEIQSRLFDRDREVRQLHWRGGTPGFLTQAQSAGLMGCISRHFKLCRDGDGEFSIEIDPREIVKGGVKHLRSLGFNRIIVGVPDIDERVQQALDDKQSLEATAAVIDEARRAGIRSVDIGLIYGLPFQTAESFRQSLELILGLDPDRIAIHDCAQLPQHRIRAEDLPSPAEKLAILNNAAGMLADIGYEYIGMDHFARTGDELAAAQRNCQGYSTQAQCDSIGFGVSAISHVSDNFSQNTNSLEAYHESLAQGRLPVVRGHESSADDILRREIIQRLSCRFRLDIGEISRKWDIDFRRHFAAELEQLATMAADGLVELGADAITICPPGRLLAGNICTVFDAYRRPERVAGLFCRSV